MEHRADSTAPWNMDGSRVMNSHSGTSKILTKNIQLYNKNVVMLQNMPNRNKPKLAIKQENGKITNKTTW